MDERNNVYKDINLISILKYMQILRYLLSLFSLFFLYITAFSEVTIIFPSILVLSGA